MILRLFLTAGTTICLLQTQVPKNILERALLNIILKHRRLQCLKGKQLAVKQLSKVRVKLEGLNVSVHPVYS